MAPEISLDEVVPRPRAGLSVQDVGGEAVILNRDSGRVHQLNATAYLVWRHLDGERTVGSLAGLMVASLEVGLGQAIADVKQLVMELGQLGLIEQVPHALKNGDVTI